MTILPKLLCVFYFLVIFSWLNSGALLASDHVVSKPLQATKRHFGPLFSKIPAEVSGLEFRNSYDDPEMWGSRYEEFQGGAIGTGITAGDVDGDGWTDLFVVTKFGPNKLYRQVDRLRFEDITENAGVSGALAWSTGASFVDVENDGDLDLYVCFVDSPNELYLNDGTGVFTEAAKAAGLDVVSGSVIGAFEDYDHDGDLDMFLLTNVASAVRSPKGEPDYLFKNDGTGRFTDVTEASGILSLPEKGHSAVWWDANGDGWSDLYIANDFEGPDRFYRNNQDGTFSDIREEALPHTAWFSMGSDFGDINNDGRLDFLVGDMASTTHFKQKVAMGDMGGLVDYMDTLITPQYMENALFINNGTDRFLEGARLFGVSNTDWTWSVRFEDLDNDGWKDLHVTNGMVRSFNDSDMVNQIKRVQSPQQIIAMVKRSPILAENNLVYRNTGDWGFQKQTEDWGLQHEGVSFGSVITDLDNDGDADIVYSNYDDVVSLYENHSEMNAISVSLRGEESNYFGVGAKLLLESRTGDQTRQISLARGALSSSIGSVHFGLARETEADRLTVYWPSGKVQVIENLPVGKHYTISETGTVKSRQEEVNDAQFSRVSNGLAFRREEQSFNDMVRQPLLPNRMNTLGGGFAVGDADADGDQDIYFAGAKGQLGELYLNDGRGNFVLDKHSQPWQLQPEVEEMAPLWLDVNGDGAQDLYVSSGSVEDDLASPHYADRLYLNNGSGQFTIAPEDTLPHSLESSSVVASADFDRDGDLDVFVGGRVVPGQYPSSPKSALLENKGGSFVPIAGFENLGMITSALWSDANGDGWIDLVTAGEWEPLRVFLNQNGRLVEKSSPECGLSGYKGWWNSLTAADVDNDGDMDYIAGNIGLNTKYHASLDHPIQLFYGDFEGKGEFNIVEAEYEGEKLFPMRGKSCSTRAMPSLGSKFPTFNSFASALLTDIYELDEAAKFEATELRHGVFVNDGDASFTFTALPRSTQIAPVFGIAASDFDSDGNVDLILGQNFYGPQVETGRFDGGQSAMLLGGGKGDFELLDAPKSGIQVTGEARSIAITDMNNDGRPDVIITRIQDSVLPLQNRAHSGHGFSVRLEQSPVLASGAKVSVTFNDGSSQAAEIYSGSGYLSQSEAKLFFGYQEGNKPKLITVRWSDGSLTKTPWKVGPNLVVRSGGLAETSY